MIVQIILSITQKYCLTFTLALTLTLAWTTIAHADSPSDLDITFGGTGVVTTSIGSDAQGYAVAIQSDGKIVVAGYGHNTDEDFAVARYDTSGSLDTSFNSTGVISTFISSGRDIGNAIAIQTDGKIVVAGTSDSFGNPNFAVVRYTTNGSLDLTFNGSGIVTTALGGNNPYANAVAIQPDGKIVVVGGSDAFGSSEFMIARYTTTGSLDLTFNGTGIITTSIDLSAAATSVAIQSNGAIVVAGPTISTSTSNFAVARYDTNGNLDTSFNTTGVITTPVSSFASSGASMVIQPDGKIVIAGNSIINGVFESDLAVLRYTATGALDPTFDNDGIVTTSITSGDDPTGMALQPNGKIVVTSLSRGIGNSTVTVIRYHPNGSLDSTFGNDGIVTTSIGGSTSFDSGKSVAIQADGKIVVAGINQGINSNFAVLRYLGRDTELSLTKVVNDNTPEPGQVITYTLIVSNSGTLTATNALISDTLPTGLTLAGPVTLDPPGVGAIGTLPTLVSGLTITPGERITVTFPVTVNTANQVIANTASVTSSEVVLPQSDSVSITVAADTQPPIFPISPLITPTQGITVTTSRPTFDWEDASDVIGVVSYTLLLTGSVPFTGFDSTLDTTDSVTTTESMFTPTQNLPNAAYTWTVQARDAAGNVSTVMPSANFSIEVTTDNNVFLPVILKNQ